MLKACIKTSYYSNSTLNSKPLEFHSSLPRVKQPIMRGTNKVKLHLGRYAHYNPQTRIYASQLQASPMRSTLELEL